MLKENEEYVAKTADKLAQRQQVVTSEIGNLRTLLGKSRAAPAVADSPAETRAKNSWKSWTKKDVEQELKPLADDGTIALGRCPRALLAVLAKRGTATDSQISALSGYRKTSSSFANGLSELRTKGLIDGTPDRRTITQAGRQLAGEVAALPRGRELLDYWLRRLSKSEAAMLRVIYDQRSIDRETLAQRAEYSITSSSFANAISGLRTLDLIRGPNGGDLSIADVFLE